MSAQSSVNNKRIAKNTLFLYIRMIFLIAVQLYTVPVVLRNLGVSDYGLYNVIGGVVSSFSFLGGTLSSGTQRYLSFALGKKDEKLLKVTFQTTWTIYVAFAIITLLLLEFVGLWFVNYKMNIPTERLGVANWLFHFSTITFIVNLLAIPFNSAIIAHEKMNIYAYVSIFEGVMKLLIAISLSFISFDKLIYYGLVLFLLSVIIQFYYQVYCFRSFTECRSFKLKWDFGLGKKLLAYSGWNVVGVLAMVGRNQGLNIIMNLFFGTLLNAAHAIATQINGVANQFINNFYMASRPSITKLYASGKVEEMWQLVFRSAKLAFYLLMLISVPVIVEMETILKLWLKDVPQYTVSIVDSLLIVALIETLVNQLISVFQAENRIKRYQQYSSAIILMCVPVSYSVLKWWNVNPMYPYLVSISLSILFSLTIIVIAKRDVHLDVTTYLSKVIVPNIIVYLLVFALTFVTTIIFEPSVVRIMVTVFFSVLFSCLFIWIIGLNSQEKIFVKKLVSDKIINKIKKK